MGVDRGGEALKTQYLGWSESLLDDHHDLKKSAVVLPLVLVLLSTESGRLKYRSQLRSLARLWLLS